MTNPYREHSTADVPFTDSEVAFWDRILFIALERYNRDGALKIADTLLKERRDGALKIADTLLKERRERFGARSTEQPDPSWLQIMKQRCRAADEYAQSRDCTLP